jgi:hypothetical protein
VTVVGVRPVVADASVTYSPRPVVASRANRATCPDEATLVATSADLHDAGSSASPHPADDVEVAAADAGMLAGAGTVVDVRLGVPAVTSAGLAVRPANDGTTTVGTTSARAARSTAARPSPSADRRRSRARRTMLPGSSGSK